MAKKWAAYNEAVLRNGWGGDTFRCSSFIESVCIAPNVCRLIAASQSRRDVGCNAGRQRRRESAVPRKKYSPKATEKNWVE